jgi:hypothetical protein
MLPRRLALCALVSALVASAPRAASADPPPPARAARPKPLAQALTPEAKGDYDAGKILFEDGDFQTARIKFEAAYDLTHDARLLWNIAVCQKNERHYARAMATLARYQAEGGDLLTAGDRRDARDLTAAMTPFTSAATFHVSEDGAQLWVDGTLVGTTPLAAPFRVDLGPRRVRAKKDGFRVFDQEVEVAGNATVTIDVAMERQSGHLALRVAANATVSIDGKEMGRGPLVDVDLPVGGHELRVTAPGMRPYQGDLVIEDARTRAFDVTLERAPEPVSEVRVAVGCGRPEGGAPEDGLSVFFDGAQDSAPAFGTRRRTEDGKVSYVPYAVEPGRHAVRVALAGCDARDAVVDAPVGGSAKVTGMLPPSRLWFDGSPAGSPDGWRLSAGITTMSQTFKSYGNLFQLPGGGSPMLEAVPLTLVGPTITGGLAGRWLTLVADVRFLHGAVGDVASTSMPSTIPSGNTTDSSLSLVTMGVRPGVRMPILFAALSFGAAIDGGVYYFSPQNLGPSQSASYVDVGAWAALDVKPWCDWGLQAGIETTTSGFNGPEIDGTSPTIAWLHVFYEPNAVCQRKRSGAFHIDGNAR